MYLLWGVFKNPIKLQFASRSPTADVLLPSRFGGLTMFDNNTQSTDVLIIDDDEMNLEMTRALVAKHFACRVLTANNGVTGLEIAQNRKLQLLILDLSMPYFTGFQVMDRLRENDRTKKLPILLCTVIADKDTITRAYDYSIVGAIKKPFLADHFVKVLGKHITVQNRNTILVVDDEENYLKRVEQALVNNFPHEVLLAESGIEAMDILRNRPVSLVIADNEMPLINGLRLLAFVREDKFLKRTPFLMMGEFDDPDDIDDAEEYGLQGILTKPLSTEKLVDLVGKAL